MLQRAGGGTLMCYFFDFSAEGVLRAPADSADDDDPEKGEEVAVDASDVGAGCTQLPSGTRRQW